MLVDGGHASTFQDCIEPELGALAGHGYGLDLVVASHVDADHITGLIAFLRANGKAAEPRLIGVKDVWHNSLRCLTGHTRGIATTDGTDDEIVAEIRRRGFPLPVNPNPAEVSARQGSSLAAVLFDNKYRWNGGDGMVRICWNGPETVAVTPTLKVIVIGPSHDRLDALRDWWIGKMRRSGFGGMIRSAAKFDDAFEFMAAHGDHEKNADPREISRRLPGRRTLAEVHEADDSIVNGSSITLLLEHNDVRVLLLADAWAADVVSSLRSLNPGGTMMLFDAVKVAHHGSMRNTSPELLELIDSPRFLISTNGDRHGHPDVEVLRAIVDRPARFRRTLYFNYASPASQFMKSYKSTCRSQFTVVEASADWIRLDAPVQL